MTEKDYFTPVKFPNLEDLEKPKAPPETDEIPDISEALKTIKIEIGRMQDGTSDYRPGALHLEKSQCPATVALKRLEERPGKKNLVAFLTCALSDFGARASGYFKDEISKHYVEVHRLNG